MDWGVHYRVYSVAFSYSKVRAEVGVKTAKRIIVNNTDHRESLDDVLELYKMIELFLRYAPDLSKIIKTHYLKLAMSISENCVKIVVRMQHFS